MASAVNYLRANDKSKPGQQLLPAGVVVLLKSLKILFGTDKNGQGQDYDPTIALVNHIVECVGALRDVNKVYSAKGSIAAKSIGLRALFGFTSELSSMLLDIATWTPTEFSPPEAAICYGIVAQGILNVLPEIGEVEPQHAMGDTASGTTGKLIIHHAMLKAPRSMLADLAKMLVKANPDTITHKDIHGALPVHLALHNPACDVETIDILASANTRTLDVPDKFGYLPLHWAVNHDACDIEIVALILSYNMKAAAVACQVGSLPLHWAAGKNVDKDSVSRGAQTVPDGTSTFLTIVRMLVSAFPDGVRTCCDNGWLPLHWCVNRSNVHVGILELLLDTYPLGAQCPVKTTGQLALHILASHPAASPQALDVLIQTYPQGVQTPDDDGYLPLHCALDSASQSLEAVRMLLEVHADALMHRTKNGWLPLHVALSSESVSVEVVRHLLSLYPLSGLEAVSELVPLASLDPQQQDMYRSVMMQGGHQGGPLPFSIVRMGNEDYIERKWTPLSKALERGLDYIATLIKNVMSKHGHSASTLLPPVVMGGSMSMSGMGGMGMGGDDGEVLVENVDDSMLGMGGQGQGHGMPHGVHFPPTGHHYQQQGHGQGYHGHPQSDWGQGQGQQRGGGGGHGWDSDQHPEHSGGGGGGGGRRRGESGRRSGRRDKDRDRDRDRGYSGGNRGGRYEGDYGGRPPPIARPRQKPDGGGGPGGGGGAGHGSGSASDRDREYSRDMQRSGSDSQGRQQHNYSQQQQQQPQQPQHRQQYPQQLAPITAPNQQSQQQQQQDDGQRGATPSGGRVRSAPFTRRAESGDGGGQGQLKGQGSVDSHHSRPTSASHSPTHTPQPMQGTMGKGVVAANADLPYYENSGERDGFIEDDDAADGGEFGDADRALVGDGAFDEDEGAGVGGMRTSPQNGGGEAGSGSGSAGRARPKSARGDAVGADHK